jgi:hypothetical protein
MWFAVIRRRRHGSERVVGDEGLVVLGVVGLSGEFVGGERARGRASERERGRELARVLSVACNDNQCLVVCRAGRVSECMAAEVMMTERKNNRRKDVPNRGTRFFWESYQHPRHHQPTTPIHPCGWVVDGIGGWSGIEVLGRLVTSLA